MTLLHRVLRAAHAKGTHHKLALDALEHLEGADADRWRSLFLKHWGELLKGAKAPDDAFKDFQNHVLHPRDGYWGGAPETARKWHDHLVEALAKADWPRAAYAAGVLSHYVTDPIQPFHTAQSEAENAIHRAFEWSVSRAYDALAAPAAARVALEAPAIKDGPRWLELLLCDAAGEANRHYEKLIAHYDVHRGVVEPPEGLDATARPIVSALLDLACRTFAGVLQRALAESKAAPPDVPLALDTVLATLGMPLAALQKRLLDAEDRRTVERMYDELRATGRVEHTLPEDERVVRDLHQAEVRDKRSKLDPAVRFPGTAERPVEAAPKPRAHSAALPAVSRSVPAIAPEPAAAPAGDDGVLPHSPHSAPATLAAKLDSARLYLTPAHDIVDAPSIGPRTAERLAPLGLKTVADLLAASPESIAAGLALPGITAATIGDWQDQARLVCAIPGLRGTHAQPLVGAGHRTVTSVAEAEPAKLCADVLAFAATSQGQRVLRDGDPPDIERIRAWLDSARTAAAA